MVNNRTTRKWDWNILSNYFTNRDPVKAVAQEIQWISLLTVMVDVSPAVLLSIQRYANLFDNWSNNIIKLSKRALFYCSGFVVKSNN